MKTHIYSPNRAACDRVWKLEMHVVLLVTSGKQHTDTKIMGTAAGEEASTVRIFIREKKIPCPAPR